MDEILKPHNIEPFQSMEEMLKTKQDVAVVSATGTGKTYLYLQLQKKNSNARTLYISPFLGINWATDDLIKEYKIPVNTASTTDNPKMANTANVVFTTYQHLANLKDVSPREIKQYLGQSFDLIVADEYDRAGAPIWEQGYRKLKEVYPKSKRIGLTATDIRYGDGERDMTQELFHGNIAFKRLLPDALREGILPTPTVVSGAYTFDKETAERMSMVEDLQDDQERADGMQLLERAKQAILKQSGVDTIFAKYMTNKDGKLLVFCEDIAHQEEIAKIIPQWFSGVNGKVNVRIINSKLSKEDNHFARKSFEDAKGNGIELLLAVNMINSGYHPKGGIDGIVLIPRDGSPNRLEQRIGRALAVGGDNPLIFDLSDSIGTANQISQQYQGIKRDASTRTTESQNQRGQRERTFANMDNFVIIDEQREARQILAQLDDKLGRFKSFSGLGTEIEQQIYSAWMMINRTDKKTRIDYGVTDIARALNLDRQTVASVIVKFRRWEEHGRWDKLMEVMPPDDWSFSKVDKSGKITRAVDDSESTPNYKLRNMRRNEIDVKATGFEDDVHARHIAAHVIGLVDGLTDREQKVLRFRANGRAFSKIGKEFNVTGNRIRQIEARAYRKIRERIGTEMMRSTEEIERKDSSLYDEISSLKHEISEIENHSRNKNEIPALEAITRDYEERLSSACDDYYAKNSTDYIKDAKAELEAEFDKMTEVKGDINRMKAVLDKKHKIRCYIDAKAELERIMEIERMTPEQRQARKKELESQIESLKQQRDELRAKIKTTEAEFLGYERDENR